MTINYDKFSVFYKDDKIADIQVNPNGLGTVKVTQYTDSLLRIFPKPDDQVTQKDFLLWLEWRVFPRTRFGVKDMLAELGLANFNLLDIISRTHGIMQHDEMWIRFEGENFTYDDAINWRDKS